MNSHLKIAHDFGVKKALEKMGYASVADVQKDIEALGLNQQPTKVAEDPAGVFAALKAKLS